MFLALATTIEWNIALAKLQPKAIADITITNWNFPFVKSIIATIQAVINTSAESNKATIKNILAVTLLNNVFPIAALYSKIFTKAGRMYG